MSKSKTGREARRWSAGARDGRLIGTCFVAISVMGVLAAQAPAANQSVTAKEAPDEFVPASVTISQGESVTWTNTGGPHNVRFDDGSFTQPMLPESPPWTVSRTFSTVGTFMYYCEAHGGSGGIGMAGTVVVNPAPGGPPGTPPPGGSPPKTVKDTAAPRLRVEIASSQRVLRKRALRLSVTSDEEGTLTARGTVSVPALSKVYKFRKVTRTLASRVKTRLELTLPRTARAAVKRALARRRSLTARLTISVKDRAGNVRSTKRKVAIRP